MGESFDVTSIPSERVIVDLANFDASVWINTTGQSGHPVSPNYRDQIEKWRNIQYDPMPYTRAAVEKRAVNTLKLEPKR
jgi:penicillin amidase